MYDYWSEWPPVHEAMKLSWMSDGDAAPKKEQEEDHNSGGDVLAFTSMPQVQGHWVGGPPIRPQDVADLAERMRKRG